MILDQGFGFGGNPDTIRKIILIDAPTRDGARDRDDLRLRQLFTEMPSGRRKSNYYACAIDQQRFIAAAYAARIPGDIAPLGNGTRVTSITVSRKAREDST